MLHLPAGCPLKCLTDSYRKWNMLYGQLGYVFLLYVDAGVTQRWCTKWYNEKVCIYIFRIPSQLLFRGILLIILINVIILKTSKSDSALLHSLSYFHVEKVCRCALGVNICMLIGMRRCSVVIVAANLQLRVDDTASKLYLDISRKFANLELLSLMTDYLSQSVNVWLQGVGCSMQ